ncbi:ribonuclease III [bacterium]|nr:ribonuclease III [bacterium]
MNESRRAGIASLLERLGLPARPSIFEKLDLALTHRSWSTEHQFDGDNERLEFFGDAVIGLAATEYLYQKNPTESEGDLSKRRAAIVSRAILGDISRQLGIGELLKLGAGEETTGGRERASNLGSALEAICGAVYLEYDWETLAPALRESIVVPAEELALEGTLDDFKSRLQEWSQRRRQEVPEYRMVGEEGPEHLKIFMAEVWIAGELAGRGSGPRKKAAENDAARDALSRIQDK